MLAAAGFVPNAIFASEGQSGGESSTPGRPPGIGSAVKEFSARDVHGNAWSLAENGRDKVTVLAILGTECPLVKAYVPRLVEIAAKYEPKGVVFLGVDPNR